MRLTVCALPCIETCQADNGCVANTASYNDCTLEHCLEVNGTIIPAPGTSASDLQPYDNSKFEKDTLVQIIATLICLCPWVILSFVCYWQARSFLKKVDNLRSNVNGNVSANTSLSQVSVRLTLKSELLKTYAGIFRR